MPTDRQLARATAAFMQHMHDKAAEIGAAHKWPLLHELDGEGQAIVMAAMARALEVDGGSIS